MDRSVYDNMRAVEQDHWWFRARRRILASQIRALRLPPGASILEVGCGTGGNLSMLSSFGEVVGVEPDEESRRYASEVSGVPVLSGTLPDGLPLLEKPCHLVAALDVIEHLDEDGAALAALRRLLAPDGVLLTTVPAHPWLWSRHDELHHHKRRYRKNEYVSLIRGAGFEVQRATFFNSVLFPPIVLARAIRMGERSGKSDDAMPPGVLNALLEGAFSAEALALRLFDMPFGVSILVIARPAP